MWLIRLALGISKQGSPDVKIKLSTTNNPRGFMFKFTSLPQLALAERENITNRVGLGSFRDQP